MKVDECATRAAAYAVVMIEHGLLEKIDFIQMKDNEGFIYPSVHVVDGDYDDNRRVNFPREGDGASIQSEWWIIAAMASELAMLKSAQAGDWDLAEAVGPYIAARITREAPEGWLYGVGYHLCRDWWEMPEGDEKKKRRRIAESKFRTFWPRAVAIVERNCVVIGDLAKKLKMRRRCRSGYTVLEGHDLEHWWSGVGALKA